MSRWALVPVKAFDRGKSRLASVLGAEERARLSRDLFDHVVQVLLRSRSLDGIAVVSDSPSVRAYAEGLGLLALEDDLHRSTFAGVIDQALAGVVARGATSALVCMSDLPHLTLGDVERVVAGLEEADVVLGPDLRDLGTNVLALRPPSVLPSCLGHEDSFLRHRSRARELGLEVRVRRLAGIGFDVDRPEDLARLRGA